MNAKSKMWLKFYSAPMYYAGMTAWGVLLTAVWGPDLITAPSVLTVFVTGVGIGLSAFWGLTLLGWWARYRKWKFSRRGEGISA